MMSFIDWLNDNGSFVIGALFSLLLITILAYAWLGLAVIVSELLR